jgi:cytochrome c-550 PedF
MLFTRYRAVHRWFLTALLAGFSLGVHAHGDVTPQAVDTTGLNPLGAEWKQTNPYRGNKRAIEIGSSAYNQNCARCHGLEAISGGIAPDLRYLPEGAEGDEIFLMRVRNGAVRDGRVYMPKFEGILSQEALWTIRAWLDTVREK